MDSFIKEIYHDGPDGLGFHVYHEIQGRDMLIKWCEEQFGKESPHLYDQEWLWNWTSGECFGTPLTVFNFQYNEDALAFKLRWM